MDEEKYTLAFQIISEAGDGRSKALKAISLIQDGKLEEGEEMIGEAKKSLVNAHHVQTKLIQQEVCGDPVDTNIIMVHSQDHFAMATTTIDLAEIILRLYRQLNEQSS